MKKFILISIILIFLTGCGIFDLDSWIYPDYGEFLTFIKQLDTPKKIGDYMLENFTYELHIPNLLTPYELYITKKGDCDDFSNFGIFIANYHNYETYSVKIFNETPIRHYVAVYVENNHYSITDNQYYYFGFDNFKEIVKFDSILRNQNWLKYIVYDYWNNEVEIEYNN